MRREGHGFLGHHLRCSRRHEPQFDRTLCEPRQFPERDACNLCKLFQRDVVNDVMQYEPWREDVPRRGHACDPRSRTHDGDSTTRLLADNDGQVRVNACDHVGGSRRLTWGSCVAHPPRAVAWSRTASSPHRAADGGAESLLRPFHRRRMASRRTSADYSVKPSFSELADLTLETLST